jgi:cyclopropane-fatty-acyl-phospholipid synthase
MTTSPASTTTTDLQAVALPGWSRRPFWRLLERLLRGVRCGAIRVQLPGGHWVEGRGAEPGPHAAIVLHRWRPLARLLMAGDIGLAQSYRDGDWATPDLTTLLAFGIANEAAWEGALDARGPAHWLHRLAHLARDNTRRNSRQNISFHYDLGNEFYAQWLDASMLYSSALYSPDVQTLEAAQAAKLARVLELLQPAPGQSVLEIGCGWGALALALGGAGTQVTGLTLSTEQLALARARVADAGMAAQVDLRLQDYRDVEGQFDRIVSIEMLEAVGERHWPTYFDTLRARLAPGGVAVVQVITMADAQFARYRQSADFIQRFIFPGGMLPSPGVMQEQAARAGLAIELAESFGSSYSRTLVDWRSRFLAAWPRIAPLGFDDAFRRLWEYYLSYCEAGFDAGRVDVRLYRLTHLPAALPK